MTIKNLAGTPLFLIRREENEITQVDMSRGTLNAQEGYEEQEWELVQNTGTREIIYLQGPEETVKAILDLVMSLSPGECRSISR